MKIISDKKTVLLISLLFTLYSCGGEDIVKNSDDPEEIIDDTLERFVPDGYTKTWEDHFDDTEINTAHWTVGSLRDPETGDIVPGADGDHLLKTKYSGYVTIEDSYLDTLQNGRSKPRIPFGSLVELGIIKPGTTIYDNKKKISAKIMADGSIKHEQTEGSIHKVAATILGAESCNGWTFWHYNLNGSIVPIDHLRQRLISSNKVL